MNASEFRKKAEQIFNKYNVKNSRFLDSQRAEKINTYFGSSSFDRRKIKMLVFVSMCYFSKKTENFI